MASTGISNLRKRLQVRVPLSCVLNAILTVQVAMGHKMVNAMDANWVSSCKTAHASIIAQTFNMPIWFRISALCATLVALNAQAHK